MLDSRLVKLAWLALLLAPSAAVAQTVLISEFLAKNDTGLEDEDGDTSDWLELYNSSSEPIDLSGWTLTDEDGDNEDGWTFPAILLAPGESLIVFASDKDRTDPDAPLHTNFKLSSDGEYLGLLRPDGTVEHEYAPTFPPQQADISYGLLADCTLETHLPLQADARVKVPTSGDDDESWMQPSFDDTDWEVGPTGIGYETGDDYDPYIGLDVQEEMYGQNTSLYIRLPFNWSPGKTTGLPLRLHMRYDDGFACWLNGIEACVANAPPSLSWTSQATNTQADDDAIVPEIFEIGVDTQFLVPGSNVLAIQGLNDSVTSSDLLMLPELIGFEGSYTLKTFYLEEPTPGAMNITTTMEVGPIVDSLEHEPAVPDPGEDILVTCTAEPLDADIQSVVLLQRRGFEPEMPPIEMIQDGSSTWSITLPGGSPGEILRWRVVATDVEGDVTVYPAYFDPFNEPEYVGVHVDNPVETQLDLIRLFVEDTEAMDIEGGTRCIVVHEGLLYDNVLVRPRGQSSLSWPKQSYKLDFNSGQHIPFLDEGPEQEELNLQSLYSDKSSLRRQMAWELYKWAGVKGSLARPVLLHVNGQFHSLATYCEQPDERMLERAGLDPDGALYKMFNLCNNYWYNVEKKTREHEDNQDLQVLVEGIEETDPELLRRFLLDTLDVPAVLSYLAATSLMHHNDHIGKNYYLYRDTEGDGEWRFLPWDKDLTFGRLGTPGKGLLNDIIFADHDPNSHPLFGDEEHPKFSGKWNHLVDAIYRVPQLREMYLRHLRTQMDLILQPPGTPDSEGRIEIRLDELRELTGPEIALDHAAWPFLWGEPQTVDEAIEHFKQDYLDIRRTHLYITHGELGGLIPGAQIEAPNIKLGELLTQPASGDSNDEFIELLNNEATPIDLSGWRLEGDVTFTFAAGSVLPAGGRAFVSPDVLSFRSRTESPTGGEGHLVLGPFAGNLATDPCQELRLLDTSDTVIDTWCAEINADVDGDGIVGVNDILLVISEWGCMGTCQGDVDNNGQVDVYDVLLVVQFWD